MTENKREQPDGLYVVGFMGGAVVCSDGVLMPQLLDNPLAAQRAMGETAVAMVSVYLAQACKLAMGGAGSGPLGPEPLPHSEPTPQGE